MIIVIAENLINDYCGIQEKFLKTHVNIGIDEIERLMGKDDLLGKGLLPQFLNELSSNEADVLLFRDYYTTVSEIEIEHYERFGEHGISNTTGVELPDYLTGNINVTQILDCKGLTFPVKAFEAYIKERFKVNLQAQSSHYLKSEIRFLIVGFHTERRVFNTANVLRNYFGFKNVAVIPQFLCGFTKEAHFSLLRNILPDNLIEVLNSEKEIDSYFGNSDGISEELNLATLNIKPKEIRDQLSVEQLKIVQSICMHWTEVDLRAMSGGFSGSALFLARGKQGNASTEPMVIKIDKHEPIRNEIRGYNLVKDFLGKHVPTFTFPVSTGAMSGIGMELASMEGSPKTLQDQFEAANNDYLIDEFLVTLRKLLRLHEERIYKNTMVKKAIAPYRHFMLHISEQSKWLGWNMENIFRHKTDNVIISEEVIINIFNLVRRNADAIKTDLCIAHGDLNLANIIVDHHENIWTIDWTHANYHPIEIDFAKMENDLKFVLCKELKLEDLSHLKDFEDYLLDHLVPSEVDDLADNLSFIKWDNRFKKIYKAVRELRFSYASLKEDEDWLIYKIALLRYALHNLSFDKTINQGECYPPQLWYALLSVENLCFQLVADDYHLQIRSEKPDNYPDRQRIQIDLANWSVDAKDYNPPYYVDASLLEKSNEEEYKGIIDPEHQWQYEDKIDWVTPYTRDSEGKPLNPRGRTGIRGRGSLWFWGPNPMILAAPIRFNPDQEELEVLLEVKSSSVSLVNVHIRRDETEEETLERLEMKLALAGQANPLEKVSTSYLYDLRQTDNAWVEAKSVLSFQKSSEKPKANVEKSGLEWKTLSPELINNLYSSEGNILRECLQYILDTQQIAKELIQRILKKTG